MPRTIGLLLLCVVYTQAKGQVPQVAGHSVTVADIIQMTTFGSQPHGYQLRDVDVPSPDGSLHAVVIKHGDIERNMNVFSLLLFRTDQLFAHPIPDTALTLASSSNRPAIGSVRWLSDNQTLLFLGESPGQLPQIYALNLRTRQLTSRTQQLTQIMSFDVPPSGDPIAYVATLPVDTSAYATMRHRGFALRPVQFVGDVLRGAWADAAGVVSSVTSQQLFVSRAGAQAPIATTEPGQRYHSCDFNTLSIAPNGHEALIRCKREHAPEAWTRYTEPYLAKVLTGGATLPELALLNLDRGTIEPLVEAPLLGATSQWSPTSESVVIANAFLPLARVDSAEQRVRVARPGIAEVDVITHRVTVIAHRESLNVVAWDSTNTVHLTPSTHALALQNVGQAAYRKTGREWREVRDALVASTPVLIVDEGLNTPPRLLAVDRVAKSRAVVLDPNPRLAMAGLGREEIVRWRTKSGRAWVGGLYLPPDFLPGRRYPLVIQTHGFDSTAFRPDGTFPTANAAQAMAAQGILVLQIGAEDAAVGVREVFTSQEAPHAMEAIEGAIDQLDSVRLIDRSHVGLIGFSRTCFHVLYALTHSGYRIAAAAISDGVDFGYLQYLLFENVDRETGFTLDEFGGIYGGPPFGKTLDNWRERAPGFNLDRVTAPLRIEAIGLPSVLEEWEAYAGLLLQHKPVELFVIPEGAHLLVKPWERLASSQGNADWFRFWLKGEEDPDPSKGEQYVRWRELRKLQQEQRAADTSATR